MMSLATSDPTTTTCPRCFSRVRNTPTEHYCPECGLVVEDSPIDHGPAYRSFAEDAENPEHDHPGNRNHPDRGLGSRQGTVAGDTDALRRQRINRHVRQGRTVDRNRMYATTEIHRMTTALELPRYVGDRAKRVFREVHHEGLEGHDLDTVAGACLYLACREQQLGRTAAEVAEVSRAEKRSIRRRLWWVANQTETEVPPPSVRARVRLVCGRLDAVEETTQRALARVDELPGEVTGSRSPSTVAAAVVYETGEWTQAEVAQAAGVCPAGLRAARDVLPSVS